MGPNGNSNIALVVAGVGGYLVYKKNKLGWIVLIGGIVGWYYFSQGTLVNSTVTDGA